MGAWNAKPFGNDSANDWLFKLEESIDAKILEHTFRALLEAAQPDADLCEEAIAAASLVLAARRDPPGALPSIAKEWVLRTGFVPPNTLVDSALAAIRKIRTASDLLDLWRESNPTQWLRETQKLETGLLDSKLLPPPQRHPKQPSARLGLLKLLERVHPEDTGPLRQSLRRKLAALPDVNAILPGSLTNTPLQLVAASGFLPEAGTLIDRGADVNAGINDEFQRTPLEEACANGHPAMAALLLARGATLYREINLPSPSFFRPDDIREKPVPIRVSRALHAAVQSGSVETVKVLVQHGADLLFVNNNGETLLHAAAEKSSAAMIDFLVQNSIALESSKNFGMTALHWAALNANKIAVAELLRLGANPKARDDEGAIPFDLVPEGRSDIAALFQGR